MKKAFFVLNPVAGQSEPEELRTKIEERAAEAGWQVQLHEIEKEDSIEEVIARAREEGYGFFVAAGGDGTVSAVAGALVGSGTPMAILPVGTGNVLARDLEIPVDADEALALIFQEHDLKRVDGLRAVDRLFLLNISAGPMADVMRDVSSEEKRRLGFFAYLRDGVQKLIGHDQHRFTVTIDGQEYQFCASEAMVLNSGAVGSPNLSLGPDVRMDDGRIEVYLLRARNAMDYVRLLWNMLVARERRTRVSRRFVATKSVTIAVDPFMAVQGDGDFIGNTPIDVEILPGVVIIAVPSENENGDAAILGKKSAK